MSKHALFLDTSTTWFPQKRDEFRSDELVTFQIKLVAFRYQYRSNIQCFRKYLDQMITLNFLKKNIELQCLQTLIQKLTESIFGIKVQLM